MRTGPPHQGPRQGIASASSEPSCTRVVFGGRLFFDNFLKLSIMMNWIITLKQKHAINIMAGKKTVELRTRVPLSLAPGDRVFVGIAGTKGSVAFSFRVSFIDTQAPLLIWSLYKNAMAISAKTFWDYVASHDKMTVIGVEDVKLLPLPRNVKEFGIGRCPQWFALSRNPYEAFGL